jgi:hypothetical protein
MTEDFKMSEMRSTPVATTRKLALATTTSAIKGCGSLAILLLFLLAVATSANALTTTTTTLTAPVASATYASGATVTMTATVSPSAATGTVTFKNGATSVGTCTLSAGTCSATSTALPVGAASLTANYPAGTTYAASASGATSITITSTPTVTLAATVNGAAIPVAGTATGSAVKLVATLSPVAATGTVNFYNGGSTSGTLVGTCTLASGTCSAVVTSLPTATNSVTAVYAGAGDYLTNTSAATSIKVIAGTTSTTSLLVALTSAPTVAVATAASGISVTLTATVPAAATGTVSFYDGITLLSATPSTIASGKATLAVTTLAIGSHSITATYGGSATYDPSSTSSASSLTVTSTPTVTLTGLVNGAAIPAAGTATGSPITLTAVLSPTTAPGTVNFYSGGATGTLVGTCTLASGTCSAVASFSAANTYSLTAVYAGSSPYQTNTSAALSVKVIAGTVSSTTLTPSVSTVGAATALTLTAGVTPSAATGSVAFYMGGTTLLGTGTLTSGTATLSRTSFLTPLLSGANSITAKYLGNATYSPSTSAASIVTDSTPTTTSLAVSNASPYYGNSVTLTATVSATAATGTVTFYDNGTSIGTGTVGAVTPGKATLQLSSLLVATHPLYAIYGGDSTYAGSNSTSAPVFVTVQPTTTTASLVASGAATQLPGSVVTLTASVTPTVGSAAISSGNVSFYDSSTYLGKASVVAGIAILSPSITPAIGQHYFIASYGGVYNSGTAEIATSLSHAAQVDISAQQTITFTALATPVTYGASPVSLSATSISGLTVTFTGSGACSASGTTLTYLSAGTCTVTASQAGNNSYAAATPVQQTVVVSPAPLTITASSPSAITYGAAVPVITATYSPFVGADTKWTLTTRPTCTTVYTTTSAPASYATSCSGAADSNYSISYVNGSVTVNQASQTIGHFYPTAVLYGASVPLAATATSGLTVSYSLVSGPGTISGPNVIATGVGTIVVAANQSGNANYTAAAQATKTVTVYPAPLTVTGASTPSSVSYGAVAPSLSATYSGFANGDSSSSLTSAPTCFTAYTTSSAPGSYPVICYGAVDPNYDITYTSGSISVVKAVPTVAGWPTATAITYGQALSASTLSGGASNGTFAWTTSTTKPGAGTPSEGVTFSPTNSTDYTNATGTVSLTVNQATPTVNTLPTASSVQYGAALSTSKLSGGSGSTPGAFTWTSPATSLTTIGPNSESVTFNPTDSIDYTTATTSVSVNVIKATQTITWPTATPITYGAALSTSSFIGGSSSVGGTFTWTNPTYVPAAGAPSESVTFTPSDQTEYTTVTHPVSITVAKALPSVAVWPTASPITYGQTLNSSVLTGGSAGGRFTWTTPGTIPTAGTNSYDVTFTPTNTTDYTTAPGTVSVTVSQELPTISVLPTAPSITFGQTLNSSTLTGGTASTDGSFNWTDNSIQPPVGTTQYSVTFTPSDSVDFGTATTFVYITVNACGLQDTTNSSYSTALNVYTAGASAANLTLDAEGINESAICAVNSGPTDSWSVAVSYPFITSGTASTYTPDSSSNGTNAAVLAYGTVATVSTGSTITITDDGAGDPGSISTFNDYTNGVFASMGGTVNISDAVINTYGNSAHALEATNEGSLILANVVANTSGTNSSVLVAGVGGGNVTSASGTYTSTGYRSSGIRAAGTGSSVALSGDIVSAQNASAVVVEGGNSVAITGGATLSSALGDDHGIFLYEGNSGDAAAGPSTFTMTNGSITYTCDATDSSSNPCPTGLASNDQNSPATLFSVANTTATITLTDVTVTNTTPTDANANGTLLTAAALNSGTTGSNGGVANFNAIGEALTGDIIVDAISTVNLSLAADTATPAVPSTLTGTINGANVSGATVNLTLDATSTWVVTGNSYLTTLNNAGSGNITCFSTGNCLVYVNGQLLTGVN